MDATTQAVTKGYSTPFGAPRTGGSGTWPDDKAFLGKTAGAATPRSPPQTHRPLVVGPLR
ncbi:hypothetical protein ACIF8T_32045 [Streptomyces sp. NPDC085946]|uniref:hypothetical protein n=1 Tax=Streptomyces sp. NPDC085946 TaxID=3365744 RepID=UPI0037D8A363